MFPVHGPLPEKVTTGSLSTVTSGRHEPDIDHPTIVVVASGGPPVVTNVASQLIAVKPKEVNLMCMLTLPADAELAPTALTASAANTPIRIILIRFISTTPC